RASPAGERASSVAMGFGPMRERRRIKNMGYRVAVVGATGNVGQEMLNILEERGFPADEVIALASSRSIGREVSYGEKTLKCRNLDDFDFNGVDFCLMSAGS